MSTDSASAKILPLLAALEAYVDEFVLIGGWVPQLYRDYGDIQWNGKLSLTTEIDAVVRATMPVGGRRTLRNILADAGLRPRPGSIAGSIWEHVEDGSDALELFTPLLGPIKGSGTTDIKQQEGIAAIALPDLDLVTTFVREIRLSFAGNPIRVRVPTLGAYIATKAMTFAARSSPVNRRPDGLKRGKDLLYIRDIMRAGGQVQHRIEQDLADIAKDKRSIQSLRRARNHLTLLRSPTAHPALGEAASMVVERDGGSLAVASADIVGATDDLVEMLNELIES